MAASIVAVAHNLQCRDDACVRMSIVAWIGLGLLGGAVAGWLSGQRGRDLLSCVVVAVLGAVIGGFMAAVLLGLDISGIDGTTVIVAAVGALVLILFWRAIPADEEVFE
jgi:uncharacterized membrane protein YeaQ/YmgE (transglycosylase-associated protein family)